MLPDRSDQQSIFRVHSVPTVNHKTSQWQQSLVVKLWQKMHAVLSELFEKNWNTQHCVFFIKKTRNLHLSTLYILSTATWAHFIETPDSKWEGKSVFQFLCATIFASTWKNTSPKINLLQFYLVTSVTLTQISCHLCKVIYSQYQLVNCQ